MAKQDWTHSGYHAAVPGGLTSAGRTVTALSVGIVAAAIMWLSTPLHADEVDDVIEALKPSPVDYPVWAGSLLKAAEDLKDQPATQVRLWAKAYELGLKRPNGYPKAIQAARSLCKAQGDQKYQWQQNLLTSLRFSLRAADKASKATAGKALLGEVIAIADGRVSDGEPAKAVGLYAEAANLVKAYAPDQFGQVALKRKDATQQMGLQAKTKRLEAAVKANPKNVPFREALIQLLVVERGQLDVAAGLLTPEVSETLRKCVPLAAKGVLEIARADCLTLGEWYESISKNATMRGKRRGLHQAKACYQRLIEGDLPAVKKILVEAKLARIDKALAEIGKSTVTPKNGTQTKLGSAKELTLTLASGVTMKLVRIPLGKFIMGSPATEKNRDGDEAPRREVTISGPFYMGVTEVTRGQFSAFVSDSGHKTDAEKEGWCCVWDGEKWSRRRGACWRSPGFVQTDDHPVVCVSYNDAVAFCQWLSRKAGKRVELPTEAQWEYACRAGTKTAYQWGNDPGDGKGWCNGPDQTAKHEFSGWAAFSWPDGYVYTSPVSRFRANGWGLYDMHGNVWEWCRDWHASYAGAKTVDPSGPATGRHRVIRGGGWSAKPWHCRSATRKCRLPGIPDGYLGFRVAWSLQVYKVPAELGKTPAAPAGWVDLLGKKGMLTASKATAVRDGVRIGRLTTTQAVAVPFTAEFVAKTDSTNIRFAYGRRGIVILNWEVRPDELRIHDFATGRKRGFRGLGQVPANQFVTVLLDVSDTQMMVSVDGRARVRVSGAYKGLAQKLAIHSDIGSSVTVKSFRIRRPSGKKPSARPGVARVAPKGAVELKCIVADDRAIGGPGVLVWVPEKVTVPKDITLTIRPGTTLKFDSLSGMEIAGQLVAKGTKEAPIVFRAADSKCGWEGLLMKTSPARGALDWCVVTCARVGISSPASRLTVSHSAFVTNVIGMRLNGLTVIEDTAVMNSVGAGVLAIEGSRGRDTFAGCTLSGNGGAGYHGTHKGFPKMDRCVISNNLGGGLHGDNMFNRGSARVTNSNIFDNKRFDVYLQRGNGYTWSNVYVGKTSSAILAKDPTKTVPNIVDARKTGRKDAGIVLIRNVPVQLVADAGASAAVLKMAAPFTK